jgi:hypothetical protein
MEFEGHPAQAFQQFPSARIAKLNLKQDFPRFRTDRLRPNPGNVARGQRTGWPRRPSSDGK